jgi:hyperpolarization activated cyclic nucleotide-gated potassium channel 2
MIVTFFTVLQDEDNGELCFDRKTIAVSYLSGWFWIDLVSIMPIDQIIKQFTEAGSGANGLKLAKLSRLTRISKFAKFVRLLKIVRMTKLLRLCKDRKRISSRAEDVARQNANLVRICRILGSIILITHILCCLWVFAARMDTENNWVKTKVPDNYDEISNSSLYLMSFYFVTTTVTTVGYGDITPVNSEERLFSTIMLYIGVLCFASLSGALASQIT